MKVESQGKFPSDVLVELTEEWLTQKALVEKGESKAAQKPFEGAFLTMPLPTDDPDNWRFKEWANWHYPVLSIEEQTRMIAAWNESRRQSAHLHQEDSTPINEFTEQQRYAVCQLYAEVKFGGHPNHENSNLTAALETVADMLRTSGVLV